MSVVPLAHYGSASTSPYQSTGWYAGRLGDGVQLDLLQRLQVAVEVPRRPRRRATYNQNQKLLPSVTGVTTFQPTAAQTFGFFSGDFSDVNFTDDSLNTGHSTSNVNLPVPHYLHDIRVYPAYGPGHVAIPNTYILGIDLSRVPAYKNNDYQDIVLLVRNVQPALTQGPVIGAATNTDLTTGGTSAPAARSPASTGCWPTPAAPSATPATSPSAPAA